jgi:mannose-6-phosphate isomerase-like protein (cupin superfamily)
MEGWYAADSDKDRSSAKDFVKNPVITNNTKAMLAEEKLSSMAHIKVEMDNKSVVPISAVAAEDFSIHSVRQQKPNQGGIVMKGFVQNIESISVKNEEFRQVLYTAKNCQLVVMALKPKGEIGAEVHKLDQFFRVEEGTGEAVLDGIRTAISAGFAVLVPAGTNHNIINTGSVPLKLYTLYAPPNHRDGVVHHTREDAEADNEHFDGKTTE